MRRESVDAEAEGGLGGAMRASIRRASVGSVVDPKYFQAVYMRGLCYEAKGDVARAKQEYSYAIQLNPDYGLAAAGLTRLVSKISK